LSQRDDLEGLYSAIETVWYHMYRYDTATSALNAADAIISLNNAIGDLISWHPRYNYETGEIDGEEIENEQN
jgi:hypothetical protein